MLGMSRTAGLTVRMKCEFAKGEPGPCLRVLAPGAQPLTQRDQHHIPGHRAQSLESNRRCTKCDMIHVGHYISKNMGFLSIRHMAETWRLLLKREREHKVVQLVEWGPPTPRKTLEAFPYPRGCWHPHRVTKENQEQRPDLRDTQGTGGPGQLSPPDSTHRRAPQTLGWKHTACIPQLNVGLAVKFILVSLQKRNYKWWLHACANPQKPDKPVIKWNHSTNNSIKWNHCVL